MAHIDTLDIVDTTLFESESEREEREIAMFAEPSDEDWNMFLSDSWVDPAEREV